MMLAPTFMYAGGWLARAPMFEGDVRQEMTCVTCDGLGKAKDQPCTTCYGRGVGDFILPGPHRPLQLVGTVHGPRSTPLVGASVAIRSQGSSDAPIIMETNKDGQFGFKFPPGEYELVLQHGTLSSSASLKVEQNPNPISANGSETLHRIERTFTLQ